MKKLSKTKSARARRKMRRTESARARRLRLKIRRYSYTLYLMRNSFNKENDFYKVITRLWKTAKQDYAKLSRKSKGLI